jgi:hypothetical protein
MAWDHEDEGETEKGTPVSKSDRAELQSHTDAAPTETKMTSHADSTQVLELYQTHVRPFLATNSSTDLTSLDQSAVLLEQSIQIKDKEINVGFLGESQVGKSTLINAVLGRRALPSGGVGPLTAQATRVRFAERNTLSVTYHGKGKLNQALTPLTKLVQRRSVLGSEAGVTRTTELGNDVEGTHAEAPETTAEYMLKQVRSMLTNGNENMLETPSDLELLDALRFTITPTDRALERPLASTLLRRAQEIRALLGATEHVSESPSESRSFIQALKDRATGWRAPLIRNLQVDLAIPLLRGMSLVDLPGVGVLNDPAGQEAEPFVREEGDVLVVVVTNKGISNDIALILERTGVITKLLFGGKDATPAIEVAIVVTHMDDVARDRYAAARDEAADSDLPIPDKAELFRALSDQMKSTIRESVAQALRDSPAALSLGPDQQVVRREVIELLCERLQVFCVSAPDMLMLITGNTDDPFLKSEASTNIPEFRSYLAGIAQSSSARRERAILQFDASLREGVRKRLASIVNMYQEGRGIAMQDWERFRHDLQRIAEPLKHEMRAYHGETIGVLKEGVVGDIHVLCKDAHLAGLRAMKRLGQEARTKHFMSLRAALLRQGIWDKRGINYPEDLTQAVLDSIASEWDDKVIKKVRDQIAKLAQRDAKLVDTLFKEALTLGASSSQKIELDTQRGILKSDASTAVAWTKDHLEKFRDAVRTKLRTTIEKPIDQACNETIEARDHTGWGAKNRILDAFENGCDIALSEAARAADRVLRAQYETLLQRLNDGYLKVHRDPIGAVVEALTGAHAEQAMKSDARRKGHVLARAAELSRQLQHASDAISSESVRFTSVTA